jgi:hypothetical protein
VPLLRLCLLSARAATGSTKNSGNCHRYVAPWGHGPSQWESPPAGPDQLLRSSASRNARSMDCLAFSRGSQAVV